MRALALLALAVPLSSCTLVVRTRADPNVSVVCFLSRCDVAPEVLDASLGPVRMFCVASKCPHVAAGEVPE